VWLVKKLERLGRRLLVDLLGVLLHARRRPVRLPDAPRILVVRLDERVGNLLLLLPLIESLRLRFPKGRIDLLASVKTESLVAGHPCLSTYLPFRKQALFATDGPLRTPARLRRGRYDLAIDAANPTDPSTTQVILTRLSGAKHTVGVDLPGFGRLFTAPVALADAAAHEIDLRLALLAPVPGDAMSRRMRLDKLPALGVASAPIRFLASPGAEHRVVVNLGARLSEKRLTAETYAAIAEAIEARLARVIFTYGPREAALAERVSRLCPGALLAPPTTLVELGHVFKASRAVVTCDTGPMHLAVAVGVPTCGIFVSTEPARYGHADAPHLVVDARSRAPEIWLADLVAWLKQTV
jgi:heptosyltransferase III